MMLPNRSATLLLVVGSIVGCPSSPEVDPIEARSASVACTDDAGSIAWDVSVVVDGPATDDGAELEIRTGDVPNPEPYPLALVGRNGDRSVEFGETFVGNTADPLEGEVPFGCDVQDLEAIFCVVSRQDDVRTCWACGDGTGTLPGQARGWIDCSPG